MKIENTEVYGWKAALRGMRNPLESWSKSDTGFDPGGFAFPYQPSNSLWCPEGVNLGPKDVELCCKLIRAGGSHRKFLRQIQVWADFTLPRYVWCEFDTYRVGVTKNSCSTMYKLGSRELTEMDFQDEEVLDDTLCELNALGEIFRKDKDRDVHRVIKQLLPEGYLQKATVSLNYEVAMHMYHDRQHHRLPEWKGPDGICDWISKLPYMDKFLEAAGA